MLKMHLVFDLLCNMMQNVLCTLVTSYQLQIIASFMLQNKENILTATRIQYIVFSVTFWLKDLICEKTEDLSWAGVVDSLLHRWPKNVSHPTCSL